MTVDDKLVDALLEVSPGTSSRLSCALDLRSIDLVAVADHAKQLALRDLQRALRLSTRLLDLAPPEDRRLQIRARLARANALSLLNRFDEAFSDLTDARAAAAALGDPLEVANVALTLVQPLARAGRLAEAEQEAELAYRNFVQCGLPHSAAMADVNHGIVLRMRDEPAEALTHFDRARRELASDPVKLAVTDSNRAEALLELDKFDGAASAFRSAIDAFDAAGNRHAAAIVEGNIAHLRSRQGRPDEALVHFERARRRFEAAGARGDVARLTAEEAETLAGVGALRQSYQHFSNSIAVLDEANLTREAAHARLGQGLVLARLKEWDRAETTLHDALRRFLALEKPRAAAETEAVLAQTMVERGRDADAIPMFLGAIARLRDCPARAAVARYGLLMAHLRQGRLDDAAGLIEQIAAVATALDVAPLLVQVRHAQGRLALARGRAREAVAHLGRAIEALDRMRGSLRAERLRSTLVSAGFEVYHDAWCAAFDLGGDEGMAAAFDALERLRARSLLDLIQPGSVSPSITVHAPDDAEEQRLLRDYADCLAALDDAYKRIGLGASETEDISVSEKHHVRLAALERRLDDLESRLRSTQRGATAFGRPVELAQVRDALRSSDAIVEYFVERDSFGAMVIRADAVRVFRNLAPCSEIAAAARRIEFLIDATLFREGAGRAARMDADPLQRALSRLYDLLIRPLESALTGCDRLGIVPFGELHGLPLHVLIDQGEPLLTRFDIAYLPSASIGVRLTAERVGSHATLPLLAMGLADEVAPEAEHEARDIATCIPGALALIGPAATSAAFHEHAPAARILHLSTHAIFSTENPASSRLRLADRWLSAREIVEIRLPGSVIMLGACDTGRSVGDRGDERYGLLRSFITAGASAVVASLWRLHDQTARQIFVAIHQRLAQRASADKSVAGTVREVQRELWGQGIPLAYWAGLFVTGGLQ